MGAVKEDFWQACAKLAAEVHWFYEPNEHVYLLEETMAGTFTISGLSASEPAGQRSFGPLTIVGTQVIGETIEAPLASGDNTFEIPPGSVACMILGPTSGSAALTLRTSSNAADVGLPISGVGYPTVYPFPSPAPSSLIVNASAAQSSPLTIAFI